MIHIKNNLVSKNYPRITLTIKNHIPSLIYAKGEDDAVNLIEDQEDLSKIITSVAKQLNLLEEIEKGTSSEQYLALINLAYTQGDEHFIDQIPEAGTKKASFQLEKLIKDKLPKLLENRSEFENIYDTPLSIDVKAEIERNENIDILASVLEMIYLLMIGKTLLEASELAIGNIHLNDSDGNVRLRERMASELTKADIKLTID